MIDLSGTEVASYVYDSWGNIKDTKGEPIIREINPIRYRGYVYDTEVDLKKFNKKLPNGGGWNLLNKAGKRIATLWEDGSVRGK